MGVQFVQNNRGVNLKFQAPEGDTNFHTEDSEILGTRFSRHDDLATEICVLPV